MSPARFDLLSLPANCLFSLFTYHFVASSISSFSASTDSFRFSVVFFDFDF